MANKANLTEKEQQERDRAREALLDNEMKMQAQFFSVRERFFVLYTDKFPMAEQEENFQLAHSAALMDLKRRYSDGDEMLALVGIQMRPPATIRWANGERQLPVEDKRQLKLADIAPEGTANDV